MGSGDALQFNPTLARENPVCRLHSFFPLLFLTPLDRVGKLEETLLLTSVVLRYFWSCLALCRAVGRIFRLASSQPTTLGGGRARELCDLLLRRGERDRIFLEFRLFFWGNSRAVFVRC